MSNFWKQNTWSQKQWNKIIFYLQHLELHQLFHMQARTYAHIHFLFWNMQSTWKKKQPIKTWSNTKEKPRSVDQMIMLRLNDPIHTIDSSQMHIYISIFYQSSFFAVGLCKQHKNVWLQWKTQISWCNNPVFSFMPQSDNSWHQLCPKPTG